MTDPAGRFLIDTNVISEFVKPKPNLRVERWFEAADPESLFAIVITFGEIHLGIEDMAEGKRRAALEQWAARWRLEGLEKCDECLLVAGGQLEPELMAGNCVAVDSDTFEAGPHVIFTQAGGIEPILQTRYCTLVAV